MAVATPKLVMTQVFWFGLTPRSPAMAGKGHVGDGPVQHVHEGGCRQDQRAHSARRQPAAAARGERFGSRCPLSVWLARLAAITRHGVAAFFSTALYYCGLMSGWSQGIGQPKTCPDWSLTSTVASGDKPNAQRVGASYALSSAMRTGTRCNSPDPSCRVAFWAGSRAKAAPVPMPNPTTVLVQYSTFLLCRSARPGAQAGRMRMVRSCTSLKLASTQTCCSGTGDKQRRTGCHPLAHSWTVRLATYPSTGAGRAVRWWPRPLRAPLAAAASTLVVVDLAPSGQGLVGAELLARAAAAPAWALARRSARVCNWDWALQSLPGNRAAVATSVWRRCRSSLGAGDVGLRACDVGLAQRRSGAQRGVVGMP